jgi:hypothetical protein
VSLFDADIDSEHKAKLEAATTKRAETGADATAEEQRRIGDLLDCNRRAFEDITYDLYNARRFVRMFPDEAEAGRGPFGWVKRLYQRIVRRVLRQQIVFNEAVLGVLEDLDERMKRLERRAGREPERE